MVMRAASQPASGDVGVCEGCFSAYGSGPVCRLQLLAVCHCARMGRGCFVSVLLRVLCACGTIRRLRASTRGQYNYNILFRLYERSTHVTLCPQLSLTTCQPLQQIKSLTGQ